MNAAQIHLALNHAPLFLSALGTVFLLIYLLKRNETWKTMSYFLLILATVFTLPVFFTGEGTEELIEKFPGITETGIDQHENMAKVSLLIIAISGIIALLALLIQKNKRIAKIVLNLSLILAIASFSSMAYTAHLGGRIRHPEISNKPVPVDQAGNEGNDLKGEKEEDD